MRYKVKISETEMDKSESESDPGGVTRIDEDIVEDKLGESLDRPVAWCGDLQPVDENVCNEFVNILLHNHSFRCGVVSRC